VSAAVRDRSRRPVHGKRPVETAGFLTDADLNPIWFERPETGPQTVEELERKQAADAQAADAQRQAETARLRKTAEPVTADSFETGPPLTLRAAAEQVEREGGTVKVERGALVISLPPARFGMSRALSAARRLYLAEEIVLEHLKARRALPDRAVLPSGKLAP
jgi:hypothetical protein